MTEAEWNRCTDPDTLFRCLREALLSQGENQTPLELIESPQRRSLDCKARLFSVACCRRLWPMLVEERLRATVLTAERHADCQASDAEMRAAVKAAHCYSHSPLGKAVYAAALFHPGAAIHRAIAVAQAASQAVRWFAIRPARGETFLEEAPRATGQGETFLEEVRWQLEEAEAQATEQAAQCILLRDIFGPLPYRPVTVSPCLLDWNGGLVQKLARVIHEERQFEDLPILADALEEAGCDNEEILGHLRQQGAVHVRGCWVIDLLLEKS